MNPLRNSLTALAVISLCAGLFAQSSVKEKFQNEYKQLVEDALHTSAADPAFWNKARQIVFGQRAPTTDIVKAKAIFQSELKNVQAGGTKEQTIAVPSHSKVTYHGKPFCLQHDAAAPGANASMWLIPNTALFPAEAQGIAKAILRYSANHPADQNVVQTILWAIRHADKTPLEKLGSAQERVLNAALPYGANKYYAFVRHLKNNKAEEDKSNTTASSDINNASIISSTDDGSGDGKPTTLEQSRKNIVLNNLQNAGIVSHGNLDPYNPADVNGILEQLRLAELNGERTQPQSIVATEENTGIATDGAQSLDSDGSTASQDPVQRAAASGTQNPEDNAYTQINANVAARVHTNSLTDSTVEIANNGNNPYQFDTSDYIGMAKPVSQPTYITPPAWAGGTNDSGTTTNLPTPPVDLPSQVPATNNTGLKLSCPIPHRTPYTAKINSVFDHSMDSRSTANQIVVAYTGETGTIRDDSVKPVLSEEGVSLFSYKKPDGKTFLVNGNYVGAGTPATLNYDGHPGIDFKTTDQSANGQIQVLAAADGVAHRVQGSRYNTIYIDHGNGYTTHYLHLSQQIAADGARVMRGDVIGMSGHAGVADDAPHLHFEVRVNDVPVDPYGWDGSPETDPYHKYHPQVTNVRLWQDAPPEQ